MVECGIGLDWTELGGVGLCCTVRVGLIVHVRRWDQYQCSQACPCPVLILVHLNFAISTPHRTAQLQAQSRSREDEDG